MTKCRRTPYKIKEKTSRKPTRMRQRYCSFNWSFSSLSQMFLFCARFAFIHKKLSNNQVPFHFGKAILLM